MLIIACSSSSCESPPATEGISDLATVTGEMDRKQDFLRTLGEESSQCAVLCKEGGKGSKSVSQNSWVLYVWMPEQHLPCPLPPTRSDPFPCYAGYLWIRPPPVAMETHLPNLRPEDADGWRERREGKGGKLSLPCTCTPENP